MSAPPSKANTRAQKPLFTTGPLVRKPVDVDSEPNTGDFEHDHESDKYTLEWEDLGAFHDWRVRVQREDVVEWILAHTDSGTGGHYDQCFRFKCARGKVRGEKEYEKKHPERSRKVPAKGDGCTAQLVVKTYPNTGAVLGYFKHDHSHLLGDANARFTRISLDTRMRIAELLRTGVDPDRILKDIHTDALKDADGHHTTRDSFVTRADIRYIQKKIEAETVRLDKDDGTSAALWVQRWLADGDVLSFKTCNTAAPEGSGLAPDSFHLIIQTEWQRQRWEELGENFAGIDGTHNTTCYENTTLFTVIVRDRWGHGIPVAWMLSSDGTHESIEYFLRRLRDKSPSVIPRRWMTDRDEAQINAVRAVYRESVIFYCWWHVLHAWQQHFVTTAFPELWTLLKAWIRIWDPEKFDEQWEAIRAAAPPSFCEYLERYWMDVEQQKMWSAVYRVERHIFEEGDTNMLIEAWHHVLKGKFLDGKRNRRLDTLICILHGDVTRHYQLRYHRQLHGFEGPDLEAQERIQIAERAREIPQNAITHVVDSHYTVLSQSTEDLEYDVDVEDSTCTCYAHARIGFCKHLAAVAIHFPERVQMQSIDIYTISARPTLPAATSMSSTSATGASRDLCSVERVAAKMRRFLARAAVTTDAVLPSALQDLEDALDLAIQGMPDRGVLPASVAVPPNVKSATETARKLPHIKRKRKTAPTWREKEPYSGGERPGKKAKTDALHAPPPRRPSGPPPQVRVPSSQKENAPIAHAHRPAQSATPRDPQVAVTAQAQSWQHLTVPHAPSPALPRQHHDAQPLSVARPQAQAPSTLYFNSNNAAPPSQSPYSPPIPPPFAHSHHPGPQLPHGPNPLLHTQPFPLYPFDPYITQPSPYAASPSHMPSATAQHYFPALHPPPPHGPAQSPHHSTYPSMHPPSAGPTVYFPDPPSM